MAVLVGRRALLAGVACGEVLGARTLRAAQAEQFPTRSLRIVSPVAAGSGADVYSRFFAKKLSEILGRPVVVENKPGGDGAIAARAVQSDPPDGHTLLVGSNTPMAVNVVTLRNLAYDPVHDFRPISGMTRTMALFLVPPNSPLHTIQDLVQRGQRQPAIQSGTYAAGYQLAAAQFTAKAGFEFETVMYRGLAQTMTDLIAGRVDVAVVDSAGPIDMIKSGQVRALATTGDARHPDLPAIPTLRESGFPGAVHYSWTSLWVDARTPDAPADVLVRAMQRALAEPDAKTFIEANGGEMLPFGPDQLRGFQMTEIERFRNAAKDSNFQPQ